MIVSFTGLDGAGKTTQIQNLLRHYSKLGARIGSVYSYFPDIRYHDKTDLQSAYQKIKAYDVIHMRFRLNSDKNNRIMSRLEKKPPKQHVCSIMAAIQGYTDHCELMDCVIEPLLSHNKVIIFDRYYYDELIFKYIYGCPDFILRALYCNSIEPDIKFYIHINASECLRRNQHRPDGKIPLYQNVETVSNLITRCMYIAKTKSLITIDGNQNREKVWESIQLHIPASSNNFELFYCIFIIHHNMLKCK